MHLLARLNQLSFKRQIAWAFAAGIILVYLTSSIVISLGSVRAVRDAMLEDGHRITENFATQSVLALLYRSADNVKDAAEATLGFPDVKSVSIYTLNGELLATFGDPLSDSNVVGTLPTTQNSYQDTAEFFVFTAPVSYGGALSTSTAEAATYTEQPEILGHVALVVGKERLALLMRSVFGFNLIMSVVLAGLLLFALLSLTKTVTQPINALSLLMRRAERGETGMRAEEQGPCDVREMQRSFNTMIGITREKNKILFPGGVEQHG